MIDRTGRLALDAAVPPDGSLRSPEANPPALLEIGRSTEGRSIRAYVSGPARAELSILVVAGQHGDEPWAREAARRWLRERSEVEPGACPIDHFARLAVVPDANPDAAARGGRRNARGIDLNRDHLELVSDEARAIHALVSSFRPNLVVDLHNYPPRRRHLIARDLSIDADVQVGFPTHPAVRTALGPLEYAALEHDVRAELARSGFRSTGYTLFQESGRARPGSQQIGDARNGLALRFGVPTVLLEGRDPGRHATESDAERTVRAQQLALTCIVRWAQRHERILALGPPVPSVGDTVPIRARWERATGSRTFVFRRAGSGERLAVPWTEYVDRVRVLRTVALPRAYAVRIDARGLRATLERHEVDGELVGRGRPALVETPATEAAIARPRERVLDLNGYVVYSVHQRAGRALAVWLEPGSRYRLDRSAKAGGPQGETERPEVVRVLLPDYPAAVPPPGGRQALPSPDAHLRASRSSEDHPSLCSVGEPASPATLPGVRRVIGHRRGRGVNRGLPA